MTRVEILLPIKGPAPWLIETLMSLQNQTYTDWRLIASMHGPQKQLTTLIRDFFPDSIIVDAPERGNLASTLNWGLRASTSPYIARIDQDDLAEPNRLSMQVAFLDFNPECSVVGTSAELIGVAGETLGIRTQVTNPMRILKKLRWKSPLIHPSVMFRRKVAVNLGGYSEVATNVEDYELWLRMATVSNLGGISEPLLKYRIHPNQITSYRSIPKDAAEQVRKSRLNLASVEGNSSLAARVRQFCWASLQTVRRLQRSNRS